MSCKKEKEPGCLYPCQAQCGETALYVHNPTTVCAAQSAQAYGYDLIYVANPETKKVFMFGGAEGFSVRMDGKDASAVHGKAFKQALQGQPVRYAWSADSNGKTLYYQTALVPLFDDSGRVANILGLVRDISAHGRESLVGPLLKEPSGRTFAQMLLAAREEEKRDISKALHDEIGTSAVVLTSLLSLVKDSVSSGNKKQALKDIAQLDGQIKNTIERVKNIIVSMRPPHLEDLGLEGAARELLENFTALTGVKHELELDYQTDLPVAENACIMLYRVIQEGLNNVAKHAHAKLVKLLLRKTEKTATVRLEDDGVGFEPPRQRSIRQVGLLAMRDSAACLGGTFKITSKPGCGTVITVTCPRVVYGGRKEHD